MHIDTEARRRVDTVLDSGTFTCGPGTESFESEFADFRCVTTEVKTVADTVRSFATE